MPLPIDALIEPLTEAQVTSTIYDLLAAVGVNARAWKSGGTARTIIAVVAKPIAGVTQLISQAIRGTFRETAEGVWLKLLAKYVYGVIAIEATFAAGGVTLANAGGGVYGFDPGDLVLLNTTTNKAYANTARIDLGSLQTLTDVPFRALESGSASTATSGQIDGFVTPLLDVTVTNPSALVGQDAQSEASLRADCADALGALSPFGAKGAYQYFCKRVPGGAPLTRADGSPLDVNRVQVVTTTITGNVTVYVAAAGGELSVDDLALVDANLKAWAVPWGITEFTANATEVSIYVFYTVYADASAGISAIDIKAKIDAALTAYFATYPIGGLKKIGATGYLFLDKVVGVIVSADPAIIDVDLVSPFQDEELEQGEFAKLVIGDASSVSLVTQ